MFFVASFSGATLQGFQWLWGTAHNFTRSSLLLLYIFQKQPVKNKKLTEPEVDGSKDNSENESKFSFTL